MGDPEKHYVMGEKQDHPEGQKRRMHHHPQDERVWCCLFYPSLYLNDAAFHFSTCCVLFLYPLFLSSSFWVVLFCPCFSLPPPFGWCCLPPPPFGNSCNRINSLNQGKVFSCKIKWWSCEIKLHDKSVSVSTCWLLFHFSEFCDLPFKSPNFAENAILPMRFLGFIPRPARVFLSS